MASASLIFLAGPNAGRRYKLTEGDYIIGRRSDCGIFVPDMRVSRQHARIHKENSDWMLEDLGSNNGTFVNGERIQIIKLKHDDEITIANNRIRVAMPRPATGELDPQLTIVDDGNPAVYVSREHSADSSLRLLQHGDAARADSGSPRLFERKLHALQIILEIAANVTDPDELLEAVVAQLLEVFPQAQSVGILVGDERTRELRVRVHRTRETTRGSTDLRVPSTIIDHVIRAHRGVLLSDTAEGHEPGPRPHPAREPTGSRMGAPLQARSVHYGVVYVECSDRSFRQDDLDLLTSIAAQAGLAIHTARMHAQLLKRQRLERDLGVARQIQRSLLREPPRVVGLEFAVHYEPAYQIGGDFYDFIWHDKEHLGIVVGDVSGKAISAALYMARLTSEIRGRAGIASTLERLLKRVNKEMFKLGDDGMFATMVYVLYDLTSQSLVFTNAGHCVPLLRRGEQVFPLHADRAHIAPIGVTPDLEVGEARVQLSPGDLLVLVSDGILEAHGPRGDEYGIKRLSRRVRTTSGGPDEVVKAILLDVDGHVANGTQGDDMTVMVMQVGEARARRVSTTESGILDEPAEPLQGEPS